MQDSPNSPITEKPKSVSSSAVELSVNQIDYIAFVAVGGLIPDPEGVKPAIKMSATQFAEAIGVDRKTLFNWRKSIPNFWDLVTEKRKELNGKDRLSQVWNGVFLKAVQGNDRSAMLYLANFDPNFRMPTQPVKHEIGNSWASLIAANRNRTAIEGEIVEDGNSNSHS